MKPRGSTRKTSVSLSRCDSMSIFLYCTKYLFVCHTFNLMWCACGWDPCDSMSILLYCTKYLFVCHIFNLMWCACGWDQGSPPVWPQWGATQWKSCYISRIWFHVIQLDVLVDEIKGLHPYDRGLALEVWLNKYVCIFTNLNQWSLTWHACGWDQGSPPAWPRSGFRGVI